MKKTYALVNLLSVVLVLLVNGLSQAQRWNDTTIGEMSQKYDNLFTPAGYAFAIWGLIFLMLVAYVIFQVRRAFFSSKPSPFIKQTGGWFALVNVLNAFWVVAFMYDYIGLSVFIMLGILISLLMVIIKTDMERWDAPIEVIVFVWWPICVYAGWIAVATIANVSAYLTSIGFDGGALSQVAWTQLMIIIAVMVNIFMIFTRNMREFAAVGIWALIAIYVRHKTDQEMISYVALGGALLLSVLAALHGFKNRAYGLHIKLMDRLKR